MDEEQIAEIVRLNLENSVLRAKCARIEAETIERCAKVAETWKSSLKPGTEARLLGHQEARADIAAAIRALKREPG